jgi:hypothetical protein
MPKTDILSKLADALFNTNGFYAQIFTYIVDFPKTSVLKNANLPLIYKIVPPPTTVSPSYSTTAWPFAIARWGLSNSI